MTSQADSEAHFEARAREYGLPRPLLQQLQRNGIRTLASLAFAVFRPGAEFVEATFDTCATNLNLGVAPTMGEMSALRRLHFESEIIITAALRSNVESADQATPKPIPFAERSARLDQLRQRLGGIPIRGQSEPSHALLDECCSQHELRALKYIEPSRCTSREHEVAHSKSNKKLKLDGQSLQVSESKTVPDEAISTTYHLAQCLQRRGIALDFANLISFSAHQAYCDKLLRHLSLDPPPCYQAATLSQIMKADKQVWTFLAQNCDDIRPNAGGIKPLDDMLELALRDYNTSFHLLPLPKESFVTNTRYRAEASDRPQQPAFAHKGKGKPKGKGKGSGASAAPRGMVGCVGRDPKGRPICFDFNLSSCSNAPAGAACPKGRHVCFKAGCHKVHAFHSAHPEEMPQKAPATGAE